MSKSASNRILVTPSAYAKANYLFVQEIGTLTSLEPHISHREKLESYLFFMVLNGSGTVIIQGREYTMQTGDCVWLDCRIPYSHESSAAQPWSLMWVHFYGIQAVTFYELYCEKRGSALFTPLSLTSYSEAMQQLYILQSHKDALHELLSHKYLTDIIALIYTDTFRQNRESSTQDKIMDIKTYLEIHYKEKISLDLLSELFYISKFHLVRKYQRLYNTTIMNDLTLIRLSHAKALLRFSCDSVEQIALSCGFQTSAYFIKVFKKHENMTPHTYRKKW